MGLAHPQPQRKGPEGGGGISANPPPLPPPPLLTAYQGGGGDGGSGGTSTARMSVGNSGSGSAEHEKCIFVVGKKYWFKYTEDQAYDYSRGKYYAGIVEAVTLVDVTWDWCDGEGKKTRKLEELQQEETGELTSEEVLQLQGNCHATRELLRTPTLRRIGGGGANPADRSQTSSQAQGGDSQRPRRATHAPPRYDEETFPSTVQQRATT